MLLGGRTKPSGAQPSPPHQLTTTSHICQGVRWDVSFHQPKNPELLTALSSCSFCCHLLCLPIPRFCFQLSSLCVTHRSSSTTLFYFWNFYLVRFPTCLLLLPFKLPHPLWFLNVNVITCFVCLFSCTQSPFLFVL